MKTNNQINYLRESAAKLQKSTEFRGLAAVVLAIALEKQIKNIVIYNYRKSGLSASFIRSHLINGMGYTELLRELEWAAKFKGDKKMKQIWKESKPIVSDLFGVMKTRNRLMHSSGGVSSSAIDASVNDLISVIEKLSEIFDEHFGYNGLERLPSTIKIEELNVSTKLFHKAICKKFYNQ